MAPSGPAFFSRANFLIIDDSDAIRNKIKQALGNADLVDSLFEARNGLEGFRVLLDQRIDLVVCDLVMPEFDGFKFLISKATRPEFSEIPVILLTSEAETAMKIRGLEQGATDYMLKPFDEGELLARIKVHLKMKFLQDELKEKNERLRELSGTDELTRIDNRRRFMEHLRTEFSRARRHKLPMALVLFDIDFFKSVNDRFGHLVGDSVLIRVVEIMRANLRQSDVLGRWGGEEISLLLPHTDLAGGIRSANRMREAIALAEFAPLDKEMRITVSGGVTSHPEHEAQDIDDLLKQTDDALYLAKSKGRNLIESA